MKEYPKFSSLTGKTLTDVKGAVGGDEITFILTDGETHRLFHRQDCCESVSINDIIGDLKDLVGSPILLAEEVSSQDNPAGVPIPKYQGAGCFTWTFYRIQTAKGLVTIRWYGESNGYYSEWVNFE